MTIIPEVVDGHWTVYYLTNLNLPHLKKKYNARIVDIVNIVWNSRLKVKKNIFHQYFEHKIAD